jgi:hypothetical protein
MSPNVGGLDRAMRIVAGLTLLALVAVLPGPERWYGLIGAVPLLTALVRWCPIYTLLGIRTCPAERPRIDIA